MSILHDFKVRWGRRSHGSCRARSIAHFAHRPVCEPLEARTVLSAVVNSLGVLVITGSPDGDSIRIEPQQVFAGGAVIVFGVPGVPDGTSFNGVARVIVDLRSGADSFSVIGVPRPAFGDGMNIRVLGGNGNDIMYGTAAFPAGEMDFRGGNGVDSLVGGLGNDRLDGGKGDDVLIGLEGDDTLRGTKGADFLVGGLGDDTLIGGDGADQLWGHNGADTLNGGKGPDALWGGAGIDQCFGEGGADRFNCADSEAADFVAGDANYHASFALTPSRVLLPETFWERLASGDSGAFGALPSWIVTATDSLADAYAGNAGSRRLIPVQLANITVTQRGLVLENLLAVTTPFRQSIVADPTLYTTERLEQLFDDLEAVAIPSAVRGIFLQNFGNMRVRFRLRFMPELVRGMPPNVSETAGFLTGLEAVLNSLDDF